MLKARQPRTLETLRCEQSDPENTSPCNTLTQMSKQRQYPMSLYVPWE